MVLRVLLRFFVLDLEVLIATVIKNSIEKIIATFFSLFLLMSTFAFPYNRERNSEAARSRAAAIARVKLISERFNGKIIGS